MAHSNISVFVTHVGCPHLCAFCDQKTITGTADLPRGEDVRVVCRQALSQVSDPDDTEIAFFGGSFTAIPREYMLELLEAAQEFVGQGKFRGIRLSTRPDYIDSEVLSELKAHGVTSIELGAQSLDDRVLEANERGHSAKDIFDACELIREFGFELGLQLMVGLYKSDEETELANLERVLEIRPETVRIYPVVVLKGTKLAQLYNSGEYRLMEFDRVISVCSKMLWEFHRAGIRVIKCGLHASEFVARDMVAGYYHPALRELCETEIFRSLMVGALEEKNVTLPVTGKRLRVSFLVDSRSISAAVGHKRSNKQYFSALGIDMSLTGQQGLAKYEVKIGEVSACI